MPFRSRAQVRKFGAMMNKGEISKATFHKWAEETPDIKKLPKKLKKKKRR